VSNYLAVATVTATLRHMLQSSIGFDVPGATVTSLRPDSLPGGNLPPSVNVYMYQATPNTAWRNADLPTRRVDGSLAQLKPTSKTLRCVVPCTNKVLRNSNKILMNLPRFFRDSKFSIERCYTR
jgi:hypothetical protein